MRSIARSVVLAAVLAVGGSLATLGAGQAGASIPTPPAQVGATNFTPSLPTSPSTTQDSQFYSIACANSSFCVSVGSEDVGNPLIEQWNGSSWSVATVPNPGAASELLSVSCAGPSFCVAVGDFNGAVSPLVDQWNGSTWTQVTPVNPAGSSQTSFNRVDCLSATWCMAIGFSTDLAANRLPLAEVWNGTTWSIASNAVLPAGATAGELRGVSCVSGSWCMVSGEQTVGANTVSLTEVWNGSTWTVPPSPNPSPGTFSNLASVSCTGSGFCAAVGEYGDSSHNNRNLVATWNGTSWTQNTVPDGPDTANDSLSAVACFSATACSAVGDRGTFSPFSAAALSWNGMSWTTATTPTPASSTSNVLLGVTCQTNWSCIAVGFGVIGGFSQPLAMTAPIARNGYRFDATDGGIFAYGPGAPFIGSLGGTPLNAPIVGMAVMPAGDGYYLVASDGGVFAYGSAIFFGSRGGQPLNKPIVGMAVTADGAGYWLVASDGGIFAYGDAQFHGSAGSLPLNKPVVGMTVTPDGKGYWFVASDGGIFSYGDAVFQGSTGSLVLNKPVVGMAATTSGGYYLVATDGGVFAFPTKGGPPFLGSTGSMTLNKPIVGMAAVAGGYYLSGSDGGVFTFPTSGGPTFYGSTGSIVLNKPIVGIAG